MVLILMGVTGAGKTTVGKLLAERLGWVFADADDYHPSANVEKMRHGLALTDDDRQPWLAALRMAIRQWDVDKKNVILACSALKRMYRDQLADGDTRFVYLKGSYDLLAGRVRARHGHFATESILRSQFADLEEPDRVIPVMVDKSPEAIASEIIAQLSLAQQPYPDAGKTKR